MPIDIYIASGAPQSFVVPDQCTTVFIQAEGAGSGDPWGSKCSVGASATGHLAVTPGETLYLYIGTSGANPKPVGTPSQYTRYGGFNGGGMGGVGPSFYGGGGGGATDVRQGGNGLVNRKIVAAGSGGYHIIENGADTTSGGRGGAPNGEDGNGSTAAGSGRGATQSAGGSSGTNGQAGSLGQGGNSTYLGSSSFPAGPGGGGGGYYGGGSGFPAAGQIGLAGGGGSSYIGGVTGGTMTENAHLVGANPGTGYGYVANQGQLSLTYNLPPTKPTMSPLPTYFRVDDTLALSFTYNDVDKNGSQFRPDILPPDPMSRADVRWRPAGTTTWVELDSVTTTGGGANPNVYTFASNFASAYVGVMIEIQTRTYDSYNAVGPWSDSVYTTPMTASTSSDVSITAPAQINSQTPTLQLALTSGDPFYGGSVAVWTDDGTGSPDALVCEIDFTQAASNVTDFVWNASYTSPQHSVSDPGFQFTNGQKYHFLVALDTSPNVLSDFSDSGAILVAINAPQPASIVATPLPDTLPPSIRLDITNPSGYDPFPASYNDLYRTDISGGQGTRIRIAHGIPLNGSYTDFLAGFDPSQYLYDVQPIHVTS